MLGSPAEQAIKTIEYLNVNNAILSQTNAQLVATARSRQQARKTKKAISRARLLSKDDADKLRAELEAKEAADVAHKMNMRQKKKEQALKKAQEEAKKEERAIQRAQAKGTREINAEMRQMARIDKRLFS
jgi:hypothetical protein